MTFAHVLIGAGAIPYEGRGAERLHQKPRPHHFVHIVYNDGGSGGRVDWNGVLVASYNAVDRSVTNREA